VSARSSSDRFAALADLVREPAYSAVLTDFDGTLAPIVRDPDRAAPLPGAASVLQRLSLTFGVVAVISGRPASFLAEKLTDAGGEVRFVGVYGCEWIEDGELRRDPRVTPWIPAARRVLEAAWAEAPEGVGIEEKGASVTIHWRSNPSAGSWASGFSSEWAHRTGLVLQPGRLAVEFRPPVGIDKGSVVETVAAGCTAVCFAGDDAGDLAAFAALDRLAKRGASAVRVAVADEESPRELVNSADLVVTGPEEALEMLEWLADSAESALGRAGS
jgi:trehalose 6-phosphate phosphatase